MCGSCGNCSSTGVSPLIVSTLLSDPARAGKFSIETIVKKAIGGGSFDNAVSYTIPTTGTADDIKLAFQNILLPHVGNMIRAYVDDTFVDPALPVNNTPYDTLAGFRALFGLPAPSAPMTAPQSKMAKLVDRWFEIFFTGAIHAAYPSSSTGDDACSTRLFTLKVLHCDFCIRVIMA